MFPPCKPSIPSVRVIFIAALALLISFAEARAAVYQVGPTRQYKTLQEVAGLLHPLDVVTVDGGVIYAGGITLRAEGAPGAVITVTGLRVNGKRPMIAGVTAPGTAVLRVLGSHYVIQGFDITNGGDSRAARCFYNVGDDVTLRDCIVHDAPMTGIAGADASGSLTLDRVEVCRCGNGIYGHQIYVGSSLAKFPRALFLMQYCYVHDGVGGNNVKSRFTRNEIEFNWIEGASYHELDLDGPDPKSQPVPPGVHCDADIIGNVFVKTPSSIGTVARLGSDGTGASRGRVRFINNTVIIRAKSAAQSGLFWLKGEIDSVLLTNNVFWSKMSPMKLAVEEHGAAPVLTGSGNWWPQGATNIPTGWQGAAGADPGFVDAASEDFRPAPASPLIGAATAAPDSVTIARPSPGERPGKAACIPRFVTATAIGAFQPPIVVN